METLATNSPSFLSIIFVALMSLTVHEYAHGRMAYRYGDDTAKRMGRLTLNPFAHVSILGTIIMPILVGFGWAKPVPINLKSLSKKQVFWVAAAGPLTNMLFAFALAMAFHLFSLKVGTSLGNIVLLAVFLNLCFVTINLIPVPPLDGYRIVDACIKNPTAAAIYRKLGAFALCLLLPWILFFGGFRVIFLIPTTLFHLFGLPLPAFLQI